MRVAPLVVRAQRAGVDSGLYGGSSEIIFVEFDRGAQAGEMLFDSHDTDRELEAACGLPLRWFDVLAQLHATPHKRLSMTELATAVLLSKSGLTRLVDRIEEAGLVQRAAAPGDRRSLLIVLTPSGEKTLKRAAPIHEDGIRRHFAAYIWDNEVPVLEAALARIAAAAARQHDSFASQESSTRG